VWFLTLFRIEFFAVFIHGIKFFSQFLWDVGGGGVF